jgi:plasmid rolling circle replication initiator protein Rep
MQDKILRDERNGKITNWKMSRKAVEKTRERYRRLSHDGEIVRFVRRVEQLNECGTYLEFEGGRLHRANFCKVRLCPMCAKRRSLKIFGQVSAVMAEAQKERGYRYIFLTLTARNVSENNLGSEITHFFKAWDKLSRRKLFARAVKGWFRALEVTRNAESDTYHPHFHVVLAVNNSYFTDKAQYINHNEWVEMWRSCLGVDYLPSVDVRKVKPKKCEVGGRVANGDVTVAVVAEVAKYAVKPESLNSDKTLEVIDYALERRRLVAFGGIFKDLHNRLNLDDAVDGDLVRTDNEQLREDLGSVIECYRWRIGYAGWDYYRVEGGDQSEYELGGSSRPEETVVSTFEN